MERETERMSEGKPKYPPLRKSCREMDERGDGGYLVGGPSFELDVRREREREGGGHLRTDQNVAEQIKDREITTELRRQERESRDDGDKKETLQQLQQREERRERC